MGEGAPASCEILVLQAGNIGYLIGHLLGCEPTAAAVSRLSQADFEMNNLPQLNWDYDRNNPLWWSRLLPLPIRNPCFASFRRVSR